MGEILRSTLRPVLRRGRRAAEEGQGLVEYAFIVVMIALVVLIMVMVIGKQTNNFYSNVSNALMH